MAEARAPHIARPSAVLPFTKSAVHTAIPRRLACRADAYFKLNDTGSSNQHWFHDPVMESL